MIRRSVAPLWIALAMGCAVSTTPVDAATPDTHVAASDVGFDSNAPDTRCDVSPVPDVLPALSADFQLDDATLGTSAPVMTGGDPVGVWVFDRGTFWVDRTANAMFNRYASSVAGTAWIAITATEFRLDYELVTTLAGTEAGTIVQQNVTRAHARWRLDREQIEPTGLVCAESNQATVGDPGRVTFTRVDDTHLTLLTVVPLEAGMTTIELHGTRVP